MKATYLLLLIGLITLPINSQTAEEYEKNAKAKFYNDDYYGAIADYTKAIELRPDYASAYYNRGAVKSSLGDDNGACQDGRKAQQLGYDATELINLACN